MNINRYNSQFLSDSVRYPSPRQQRAIIFLISCPKQEEACRGAGVTRETVHTWMKDPVFREELEEQREAVFSEALNTRKQSANQAVATLRNLLNSENESIRLKGKPPLSPAGAQGQGRDRARGATRHP
jgi:response regulator RpfG family c-di-GMP phosphodiesterase